MIGRRLGGRSVDTAQLYLRWVDDVVPIFAATNRFGTQASSGVPRTVPVHMEVERRAGAQCPQEELPTHALGRSRLGQVSCQLDLQKERLERCGLCAYGVAVITPLISGARASPSHIVVRDTQAQQAQRGDKVFVQAQIVHDFSESRNPWKDELPFSSHQRRQPAAVQTGEGAGCTPARQCGGIGRALEANASGLRSPGDSWLHVVGGAAGHVRAACQRRRWAPAGPREATRVGSSPRAVPRGAHQKGVCVGSCLNSYFVRPGSAPGPCKQPSKCERVLCLRCVV